jgi:pimeloyl-ACP methyl ester carboxylesterase
VNEIELSAGTIEYQDTGGNGPVLVLLHGLMMDASLWDEVIAALSPGHRCVAPTLPLGAHRHAMDPGADLSLPGIARLTAEFLDRLDLRDVTLVGNDPAGRSSSCSWATETRGWHGPCSSRATRSTTSRPA